VKSLRLAAEPTVRAAGEDRADHSTRYVALSVESSATVTLTTVAASPSPV
jgi:hypothetical protein